MRIESIVLEYHRDIAIFGGQLVDKIIANENIENKEWTGEK